MVCGLSCFDLHKRKQMILFRLLNLGAAVVVIWILWYV